MYYIKKVTTNSELMGFIKFPRFIYQDDPHWVQPLFMDMKYNLKKSPFWKHANQQLFMAYEVKTNKPVGRIAAIIDHNFNNFHSEKTGFFGFFEAYNNTQIARLLLDTVATWLREQGINKLLGPFSPSSNDICGFLIRGFEASPKFMMPYNPEYYISLMDSLGLKPCKQLYAYDFMVTSPNNLAKAVKISERTTKQLPNFSIRPVNFKNIDNEVENVITIYNQAWSKNWGFVPWTHDEFKSVVIQMKQLLVKELILLATVNGTPVGLIVAIPNYNQSIKELNGRLFPFGIFKLLRSKTKIKSTRVLIMGVMENYRSHGIDIALINQLIINGQKLGYNHCELSWILEDNKAVIKAIEWIGGKLSKKYQLYEADLNMWN